MLLHALCGVMHRLLVDGLMSLALVYRLLLIYFLVYDFSFGMARRSTSPITAWLLGNLWCILLNDDMVRHVSLISVRSNELANSF